MTAPVASGWSGRRVGLAPTGKRRLLTAHTLSGHSRSSCAILRGEASRAINLAGIDPVSYYKIIRLPDYLIAGDANLSSEDIVVGMELATLAFKSPGDARPYVGYGRF